MGTESPAGGAGGGFDISSINRNDLAVMIAGVVAFIASFLPFWGVSIDSITIGEFKTPGGSDSITAWHSYGFLGVLLVLAAAVLIALITFMRANMPTLPIGVHLLAAGLAALGTLLLILRAFTYDGPNGGSVSSGVKWGAYVLFVAGIAEAVFAVLGSRESGEKMPSFGQSAGSPPPTAPPPPPAG